MRDRGEALFLAFFFLLRRAGLPVTVTEWLTLIEALSKGLVAADLHRFYAIARATLVKRERDYDTFDQCFAHHFAGAELPGTLAKALEAWLEIPVPPPELPQAVIDAMERLDLEALRRLFEERMAEQTERHDGGSRWIGTGGTSPFGHSGVHPQGIRVGGRGGGRSAVQVAARRRYRAYRTDQVLDTRQIAMALRRLRKLGREGRPEELDIDQTVHHTARNCGDLDVILRPPRENNLKLLLLMDVGGSMDPFAQLVSRLFSAAHAASHFRAFDHYYFHNCPYQVVYGSARFTDAQALTDLIRRHPPETRLVVVGDAHMAPYELSMPFGSIDYYEENPEPGEASLRRLADHFTHRIWLNPLPERIWRHPTIHHIGGIVPMFQLTLDGLEAAVAELA